MVSTRASPLLGIVFVLFPNLDIYGKCKTVLESLADLMTLFISHQKIEATGLPIEAPNYFVAELYSFVHDASNGKEGLQAESNCESCKQIMKKVWQVEDWQHWDADVVWYFLTNQLLMEYLGSNEKGAWAGVCKASLLVWPAWMLDLCDLNKQGTHLPLLPATDGRNLLYLCGVEAQVGHNDFKHRKSKSHEFLAIFTGAEGTALYFCPGSPKYASVWGLRRPCWRKNCLRRWSRFIKVQGSSGMDTYSIEMQNCFGRNLCDPITSTWYLRIWNSMMPLALVMRLVCQFSGTTRRRMQWMSRK